MATMDTSTSIVGISVVTTTWNERENVEELISRVRTALTGRAHEVIVVDDNSSDGTLEVAKQFADLAVGKARKGKPKVYCMAQNWLVPHHNHD